MHFLEITIRVLVLTFLCGWIITKLPLQLIEVPMSERIKMRFSKFVFLCVAIIITTADDIFMTTFMMVAGGCAFVRGMSYLVLTRRENGLPQEFQAFVDRVSLQMRGGQSFRKACEQSCETGNLFVQSQLHLVVLALSDQQKTPDCLQQMPPKLRKMVPEFLEIASHSHQLLRRVDLFRKKMKLESDFRRRSGEAAIQIRIQSMITGVLYIGLLIFVIVSNSSEGLYLLILVSLLLFGIGAFWILSVGRSYKWKL